MCPPMLASELSNRQILTTDGEEVGHVSGLAMDPATGALETLIVTTERDAIFGIDEDPDGEIRLPAEVIEAVRDYLIITPPTMATKVS